MRGRRTRRCSEIASGGGRRAVFTRERGESFRCPVPGRRRWRGFPRSRPAAVAQVCAGAGVLLPVPLPVPLPVLPEAGSQPLVRVCTHSAAGCWSPSQGASLRPCLQFFAPSRGRLPLPSVSACGISTEIPATRGIRPAESPHIGGAGQQAVSSPARGTLSLLWGDLVCSAGRRWD